jgi:hypothetical protein
MEDHGHCYQEKCSFGKVSRMTADGDSCDGSDFNNLLHLDEPFLLVASQLLRTECVIDIYLHSTKLVTFR